MSESYDYLFQIALLGLDDIKVQNVIFGMTNSLVEEASMTSIGISFGVKSVEMPDFLVRFQVSNISNRIRFANMRENYLSHKQGAIIIIAQNNISEFHSLLSEVLNYSGSVPVELVLCCGVAFSKKLKLKTEEMQEDGLDLDIDIIFHPHDIYDKLARDIIEYYKHNNPKIKLNVLVSDNFFPNNQLSEFELDSSIGTFLDLLAEKITIWKSFNQGLAFQSCSARQSDSKPEGSIVSNQKVTLTELLKSMNLKTDSEYKFALVRNKIGLFKVSLSDEKVLFIPKKCFKCKYRRGECYRSLCIIPKNIGWSNLGLSKRHLSIISKIYFIKENMFHLDSTTGSENILTQIKNKKETCPGKKVNAKFKIKKIFYELDDFKNKIIDKKILKRNIKNGLHQLRFYIHQLRIKINQYSLNPIKYLRLILDKLRDKLFQINYIQSSDHEGSFSSLRDEMLAELRRLKDLIEEN
ncbi:MAG: hypothetical protein GF329_06780 [Candidatus Lokiarchaeota archaeon]|nr:hypothetical protein [Candidatus Lokiarchaeota archaeon]